jgi:hypothetical protein
MSRVLVKSKYIFSFAAAIGVMVPFIGEALAQNTDVSQIAENVTFSSRELPGMVNGMAYLFGALLAAWGIIAIKNHVESPQQTPLRDGMIKLLVGGALFSLPIITSAMKGSIDGGVSDTLFADPNNLNLVMHGSTGRGDVNEILGNMEESVVRVPAIVSAVAYLLGLLAAFSGLLKVKETVENPQQVQVKEPVVRFLFGGAMFALPTIYLALFQSIKGADNNFFEFVGLSVFALQSTFNPGSGVTGCAPGGGAGANMTEVICNAITSAGLLPGIFMGLSYLAALFVGLWGVMKVRDHALAPQQTSIWEGVMRLFAAGCFAGLPVILDAMFFSVATGIGEVTNTSFSGTATGNGLDAMLERFMGSVFAPMNVLLSWFGMIAGFILIMIGISRLIKSTQEGTKSPIGLGTMMTFLTGAALLSFSPMVSAFSASFFGDGQVETAAALQYVTGMDPAAQAHAHSVISSILMFMIVLGLVSFSRGIFIMRAVAEGNSQASMMAGITHLAGGALAVNLGPLMNAIQNTLGLSAYGVTFS